MVDDEENIRQLLSVSLKFQGYEVETAAEETTETVESTEAAEAAEDARSEA